MFSTFKVFAVLKEKTTFNTQYYLILIIVNLQIEQLLYIKVQLRYKTLQQLTRKVKKEYE